METVLTHLKVEMSRSTSHISADDVRKAMIYLTLNNISALLCLQGKTWLKGPWGSLLRSPEDYIGQRKISDSYFYK